MGRHDFDENELKALGERFLEIQAKAKQLGIFMDDRDLLECTACQLCEDVAIDGRLFTYWGTDENCKDTGMRFIELNQSEALFQCPHCGKQTVAQNGIEY